MADAFLKLYKKMLEWEWYDDVNTCRVFLHCLLKANWKSGSWHGVNYSEGQFITSLESLAVETHLSVQNVRTALQHLISTGELTSKSQGKCRIITVNNWCLYQGDNKQPNKKVTKSQQDANRVLTTDKEYKEDKELKEIKNKYYPNDDILDKAFADFVEYRKKIKKPMTDKAIELNIKDLDKLSGGDSDLAIKIINQSIKRGWQGLFELKEDKPTQQSLADQWLNA